jgi:SOS-response transcriptional repressor LexA
MLNDPVNSLAKFSNAYALPMDRIRLLKRLINALYGDSQADFARAIHKSPAQVNQWLTGYRALGDGSARKIETLLNMPGYFDGRVTLDDTTALRVAEHQKPYSADSTAIDNVYAGPDTRGLVPVISWVQAGHWHDAEMHDLPDDELEWRPCPISHGVQTYALRVEGDSMTAQYGKSYPAGSIIYIDPDQAGGVVSGNSVIAKINGDAKVTFKVFIEEAGKRYLKPLNPQYPMITDPFRIIGKVIGTWIDE